MKRIFRIILPLFCMALLTGGCGKKDNTTEPGTNATEIVTVEETVPTPETETAETNPADDTQQPQSDIACPSVNGALSVAGTRLVDENGNPVQLRGISTHGLAWLPQDVNEALFTELHENWDVNVIRLAMYTGESGGYCSGGDKEQLKELVNNGVTYATNQDLYVIIDWHTLSDNNPNQYKSEALSFWDEMSKTYASHNNVLYEICNEPNGGTSWSDVKQYANEVIPVIRANDPDAVILVGTPNWAQRVDEAAADPISGYDNIMYTLHFYAATHKEDLRNTMVSAIEAGLPVFVSEYGICDASGSGAIDEAQANAWIDTMNQYGISYVAWNLSNKSETSAIFSNATTKTSGFSGEDLSDSGKWLYKMLTGDSSDLETDFPTNATDTTTETSETTGSNISGNSGNTIKNGDLEVTTQLTNSWEADGQHFYQYNLTITNISGSDCSSWAVDLNFSESPTAVNGWNGNYTLEGTTLHISPADYNSFISAGNTVWDVGFIVSGSSQLSLHEK